MARSKSAPSDSSAHLGFAAKLWLSADKLRSNRDAAANERSDQRRPWPAPCKHAALGLNRPQSRTLATLRDTLLLKLLRGEFSVSNFKN